MKSVPPVAKPTARHGSQSYARAAMGGGMSDAIAARMEAMEVMSKKTLEMLCKFMEFKLPM